MKRKPISPLVHGIIDYTFALALLSVPSILKLSKKARSIYAADALTILSYSAFTKYPPSVKPVIPLPLHKKLDYASLALIGLEAGSKEIRKDKRALIFSAGMITAGLITVLLTDWNVRQPA